MVIRLLTVDSCPVLHFLKVYVIIISCDDNECICDVC